MTKQLLISIQNPHPEQASWIIIDEKGAIQESVVLGNMADLKRFAHGYEVSVIIPGEDVLLTQVTLPKLNRQRLLQAVPFALEETLIDDIQHLHFALGDYQADNTFPVAVIAKSKIEKWLNTLKENGIAPSKMIPATLAIPYHAGDFSIYVNDETCIVRNGKYHGFICDTNHLNTYLDLQPKADGIHLYRFSENTIAFNSDSIAVNEINLVGKNVLENMHDWLLTQPTINLLQGHYQSRQKTTVTKKIWLGVAAAGIAWVTLVLLNNLVSFFILQQASNKTEQAINKIYKQHFPDATAIVAPRERMESKLKKITAQSNKNDLLVLLSIVGNSLNKTPDLHLQTLDFRDNRLNLTVLSASFASLDAFSQSLKQQGLIIKQQSADMAGTQVKANLFINKGAS